MFFILLYITCKYLVNTYNMYKLLYSWREIAIFKYQKERKNLFTVKFRINVKCLFFLLSFLCCFRSFLMKLFGMVCDTFANKNEFNSIWIELRVWSWNINLILAASMCMGFVFSFLFGNWRKCSNGKRLNELRGFVASYGNSVCVIFHFLSFFVVIKLKRYGSSNLKLIVFEWARDFFPSRISMGRDNTFRGGFHFHFQLNTFFIELL